MLRLAPAEAPDDRPPQPPDRGATSLDEWSPGWMDIFPLLWTLDSQPVPLAVPISQVQAPLLKTPVNLKSPMNSEKKRKEIYSVWTH